MTGKDESRRGAGRTMGTMLAAQLDAAQGKNVAYFGFSLSGPGTVHPMQSLWLQSVSGGVAERLHVFMVSDLDKVTELLRGRRFDVVYVDHHIIERAETTLEARVKRLHADHKRLCDGLETIR
jgi:hypothetical protein